MSTIQTCGGMVPVPVKTSFEHAAQESIMNMPITARGLAFKPVSKHQYSKFWAQNRTLKVGFFFEWKALTDIVKSAAAIWMSHMNIKMEFIEDVHAADIRISNNNAVSGHWSYVGTDARTVAADQPTMNFDVNAAHSASYWKVIILHEFGHALGLEHEHQHPGRTFEWNTAAVYRIYKEHLDWDQQKIYYNIFDQNNIDVFKSHPYDHKSIMHYGFPKEVIWGKTDIPTNRELSKKDIDLISAIYPK